MQVFGIFEVSRITAYLFPNSIVYDTHSLKKKSNTTWKKDEKETLRDFIETALSLECRSKNVHETWKTIKNEDALKV